MVRLSAFPGVGVSHKSTALCKRKILRFLCFLHKNLRILVGVAGFEPTASWTRTKRDTKLRHTPNLLIYYTDKAGKSQVLFHRVREFHPSPRSGISYFTAFGNFILHRVREVLPSPRSGSSSFTVFGDFILHRVRGISPRLGDFILQRIREFHPPPRSGITLRTGSF